MLGGHIDALLSLLVETLSFIPILMCILLSNIWSSLLNISHDCKEEVKNMSKSDISKDEHKILKRLYKDVQVRIRKGEHKICSFSYL